MPKFIRFQYKILFWKQFQEPYYGKYDDPATNFIAPGVAVGFLFFMGALTCGLAYIIEKKDGMLNRTIVAGVNTLEIMISHLITQFGVGLVQTILAFIIMFVVFDIPREGSPVLAFVLTILCSIAGMSLGKKCEISQVASHICFEIYW